MIKEWNWTLLIIAIINILGYVVIFNYLDGLSSGMAIIGVIILPVFIIFITILVLVLCIVYRKKWFNKNILFSTIISIILSTPIPILLYFAIQDSLPKGKTIVMQDGGECGPTCHYSSTTYNTGEVYKEESIYENDSSGVIIEKRYWYKSENSTELKKDSTWMYFNHDRDIVKIEYFDEGRLLNTKRF